MNVESSDFYALLSNTGWLQYLSKIIAGSNEVVRIRSIASVLFVVSLNECKT